MVIDIIKLTAAKVVRIITSSSIGPLPCPTVPYWKLTYHVKVTVSDRCRNAGTGGVWEES